MVALFTDHRYRPVQRFSPLATVGLVAGALVVALAIETLAWPVFRAVPYMLFFAAAIPEFSIRK